MAENELKKEGVPDKTRRKASLEHTPITQKKLNKVPTVKRAKLLPKNGEYKTPVSSIWLPI